MHTQEDLKLLWRKVMQEFQEDFPVYYSLLKDAGWRARVANQKNSSFGWCHYIKKEVVVNWYLHKNSEESKIVDTMLHEIAHAIDGAMGKFSKHGAHWKKIASEIGAVPKSKSKAPVDIEYPYVLVLRTDTETRNVKGYNRKPQRMTTGLVPNIWLTSDKDGTHGKLWLYKWNDWVKLAKQCGVSPFIKEESK